MLKISYQQVKLFDLTNQKQYSVLGSTTASVLNFCAHSLTSQRCTFMVKPEVVWKNATYFLTLNILVETNLWHFNSNVHIQLRFCYCAKKITSNNFNTGRFVKTELSFHRSRGRWERKFGSLWQP